MNGTLARHPDSGSSESGGFQSIVHAARSGAADAREAASRFLPAAAKFATRCAYGTAYGISYGVVFPSYLIAQSIPRNNPVVHGFTDGAAAAIDLARETKAGTGTAPALSAP